MLTNSELSYMREAIGELLPDTCNLLTATNTPDGAGGVTTTWGTASASVACRMDYTSQNRADESITAASLRPYSGYILSIPHNTTINTEYRVEHSGFTYNVLSVNNSQSLIAVKRVVLERID